jgi:hypothetical protein
METYCRNVTVFEMDIPSSKTVVQRPGYQMFNWESQLPMYRFSLSLLPSLKVLNLELQNRLDKFDHDFERNPSVEHMHIRAPGISNRIVYDPNPIMDSVKSLTFENATILNASFLLRLSIMFPALEHLTLSRSETTDIDMGLLHRCGRLRTLVMENVSGCNGSFLSSPILMRLRSRLTSIVFKKCVDVDAEQVAMFGAIIMSE